MARPVTLVGKKFKSTKYGEFEVIGLRGKKALIQFVDTGFTRECWRSQIYTGAVHDISAEATVFGVGMPGKEENKLLREYTMWYELLAKCYNPRHRSYSRFGGRGLVVYKDWLQFENFLQDYRDFDANRKDGERTTIRISNDEVQVDKYCFILAKSGANKVAGMVAAKSANGTVVYPNISAIASSLGLSEGSIKSRIANPYFSNIPFTFRVPKYMTTKQAKEMPFVFYNPKKKQVGGVFGAWNLVKQFDGGLSKYFGGKFSDMFSGVSLSLPDLVSGTTYDGCFVEVSTNGTITVVFDEYSSITIEKAINGNILKCGKSLEVVGFSVSGDSWKKKIRSGL